MCVLCMDCFQSAFVFVHSIQYVHTIRRCSFCINGFGSLFSCFHFKIEMQQLVILRLEISIESDANWTASNYHSDLEACHLEDNKMTESTQTAFYGSKFGFVLCGACTCLIIDSAWIIRKLSIFYLICRKVGLAEEDPFALCPFLLSIDSDFFSWLTY